MADPCQKRSWKGRAAARKAARQISSQSIEQMRAYRCGDCGRWHLTSKPTRDRPVPSKPRRTRSVYPKTARTVEELEARAAEIRAGRDPAPNEED